MRRLAAFAFAVVLMCLGPSPGHADKRVALVIGNGAYASAPRLPNPRNDAEDVATALRRAGFETIVGLDLGRTGMDDVTIRFARAVRDADVALLYYSGHAVQFAGINYLMPVDASLSDEADLRRMTRVDEIVADLQQARAVRILVLDSCRDNPLSEALKRSIGLSRAASLQRGLARIDAPQGMIVAFATQSGSTASDGSGRNSPYTSAFLRHIETPDEIGMVFRRISTDVYEATKHVQLPELSISLIGEFYLRGTVAMTSPATTSEAERAWPFMKDTSSIAVLEDFIARYRDTIYATMARARLDELKKKGSALPTDGSPEPILTPPASHDVAPALKSGRSWVGVQIKRVTDDVGESLGLKPPRGAFVVSITDYGPAKVAGLQSGDVVVKFDGKDIKEVGDLTRNIADTPLGKEVEVLIVHNGKEESRKIKPVDEAEAARKAADSGDAVAMNNLGHLFRDGRGIAKNEGEALRWYRKAADAGNARGMSSLGFMYANGRGVAKDEAEAMRWYRKAADAGDLPSMSTLANSYRDGRGVSKDEAEAVRWYRKAADAGHADSMTNLGFMYETGRGIGKDDAEAARWYRKAADAGESTGMSNLGNLYRDGRGVPKDEAEAIRWYRKAADAGSALGMNKLGHMYRDGRGVAKDESEALRWYRKAADVGNADGMNNLGFMYDSGRGVPKDEAQAVLWYRKAADAGNAQGMNKLGFMYDNGRGVTKDEAEAARWYRKAADAGESTGMSNLGIMHREGRGVTKDEAEAVRWFRKAADAGNVFGMTNLGFMYETGRGTAKDEVEAARWYRKAGDAGESTGMTNLANLYRDGRGVPKDEAQAVLWYRKAADLGNAPGMNKLGFMYENGRGVAKDEAEATRWYRKAADGGDKSAAASLQRLGR
jgi:TPR repeat protein/uncharacterized caspase-like protein